MPRYTLTVLCRPPLSIPKHSCTAGMAGFGVVAPSSEQGPERSPPLGAPPPSTLERGSDGPPRQHVEPSPAARGRSDSPRPPRPPSPAPEGDTRPPLVLLSHSDSGSSVQSLESEPEEAAAVFPLPSAAATPGAGSRPRLERHSSETGHSRKPSLRTMSSKRAWTAARGDTKNAPAADVVTRFRSSPAAKSESRRRASRLASPLVAPPRNARMRFNVTPLIRFATLHSSCCLTDSD